MEASADGMGWSSVEQACPCADATAHLYVLQSKGRRRALEMKIPAKLIADVLHMKIEQVKLNAVQYMARIERSSQMVPIKRVIAHRAGGTLTREQAQVVPHLQGSPAGFLVNQLLLLLRNDLLDGTDEKLRELLIVLRSELSTYLHQ
jgi:hypothetical protein